MPPSSRSASPVRPWRGVSATQRTAERRERVISAGLEVFGTEGYASATVRDVCRAAGLTERYFYESFRNREALLAAVSDRIVAESLDAVAPALAAADRPLEEIARDALGRFVASLVDDPRRARVLLVETVGVSPPAEDRRREIMQDLAAVARRALQAAPGEGAPADADVDLTARALVGASDELLVGYVRGELTIDRDRLVDHLTALFLAAAPITSSIEGDGERARGGDPTTSEGDHGR